MDGWDGRVVWMEEVNNITLFINYVAHECWQAYLLSNAEISVGSNQAFGRGLFVVDPDVA